MYVFRDGRRCLRGEQVRSQLVSDLEALERQPDEETRLAALISAGELECALIDAGSPNAATAEAITEQLAAAMYGESELDTRAVLARAAALDVPELMSLSVAEGFAYYALHPAKLLPLLDGLEPHGSVTVIGIRSIGTTLSAFVLAALRRKGIQAQRMTVRPHGHPYNRELELSEEEQSRLRQTDLVVIVDEGPGLSGSSFLATAGAVERAGVPASKIVLMGTRDADPAELRAEGAAERWPRYRFLCAASEPLLPEGADLAIGGGIWRRHFANAEFRPSWTSLETSKYLSHDRRQLLKFHGFGHYGQAIAERASRCADAGFSTRFFGLCRGFGAYEFVPGRMLGAGDLSPELLGRMADYLAFRVREMATDEALSDLENMARWNWQCEFGSELDSEFILEVRHRVISDARMMPEEWLFAEDGRILKLDHATHGDDHFFPGPCDIAWDVAGAIIEWGMDEAAQWVLVKQYRERSGDDVQSRLPEYLLTYAIFRMGWSKMASQASGEQSYDGPLLWKDYERYRAVAQRLGNAMHLAAGAAESGHKVA